METEEWDQNSSTGYEMSAWALRDALQHLQRLEDQSKDFEYGLPPHMEQRIRDESRRVRNAVRALLGPGADEA